jgi:hypothetical protein
MIYSLLLRSIGYSEVASTAVKSFHPLSSVIIDLEEESSNMPRPDFTQMIPFKPKAQAIPGDHPVPGMFSNTDTQLCYPVIYWHFRTCFENL